MKKELEILLSTIKEMERVNKPKMLTSEKELDRGFFRGSNAAFKIVSNALENILRQEEILNKINKIINE